MYVRRLLWAKQPEFASALESVALEWRLTHRSATTTEKPSDDRLPDSAIPLFIAEPEA